MSHPVNPLLRVHVNLDKRGFEQIRVLVFDVPGSPELEKLLIWATLNTKPRYMEYKRKHIDEIDLQEIDFIDFYLRTCR